MGASINFTLTN